MKHGSAGKINTNVKIKKPDEGYKSKIKLQWLLEEEMIRVNTVMDELMEIRSVLRASMASCQGHSHNKRQHHCN